MKEYFGVLQQVGLFRGINAADLASMLQCLGAEIRKAGKGEILLLAGNKPYYVGVVLSGHLHVIREDYEGNRAIIAAVAQGGLFAESLCCAGLEESPLTVVAAADCTILQLRFERVLHICKNACVFHHRLIENMLRQVAEKNLSLRARMDILSIKSVRAKVLRYLETFGAKRGEGFMIPFNREQMADYLCVERSALSHELAKMKRDGLIDYNKNWFALL